MARPPMMHLEKTLGLLEKVVATSPADFTEILWIEQRNCQATTSPRRSQGEEITSGTLVATVQERGRFGMHRTDSLSPSHLQDALRHALAQAKVSVATHTKEAKGRGKSPKIPRELLFDPNLAHLEGDRARELLGELVERHERAHLDWIEGRVAIANSQGLRKKARATQATLFVTSGRGAEAGTARASARSLKGLEAPNLMRRARQRRATPGVTTSPERAAPGSRRLVFSPEAAASLLEEWCRIGFLPLPELEGKSFHEHHEGRAIFSPWLNLVDDAGAEGKLPFPFDLRGRNKRARTVVTAGVPQPLDGLPQNYASSQGLPEELALQHLSLQPGDSGEEDLLAMAEDGLWIGSIQRIGIHDPVGLGCHAQLRGLRRIHRGRLAEVLPDREWETNLMRVLAGIQSLSNEVTCRASRGSFLGGFTAPSFMTLPQENPTSSS
ncbi:MAG: hypothetical protein K0U98_26115 [Deltaproteobacteria bacterium]|nr:hypothetical protein [Deltaproteobacteria bacterium]